jgi:hypothetical protein
MGTCYNSPFHAHHPRRFGGGGISIGFDAVSLHLNVLQLGIVTVKVVYDEERQQKLISGLLDYLLHGDLPAAEERLTRIQVAKIELYQILSFVAPTFKHPAFKEEAEWRLIYSGEYFDLIRQFGVPIGLKPSTQFPTLYRETPRELVPYVALPLAATGQSLELASVTIGPSEDADTAARTIKGFLVSRTVKAQTVRVSGIPLRQS